MPDFSKITGALFSGKVPMVPELKNSLASLVSLLGNNLPDTEQTVLALVKTILSVDGAIPPAGLDLFRQLSEEAYGVEAAQKKVHQLLKTPAFDSVMQAKEKISALEEKDKEDIFRFLINLSVASGKSKLAELSCLASAAGIEESVFNCMAEKAADDFKRRARILSSGAGLLVAVIVIAVFILTATLLRSVIFGLIVAYLLIPVEKFFENRLRQKRGIVFFLSKLGDILIGPLVRLSSKLTRKSDASEQVIRSKENRKIIEKAVGFTAVSTLIVILAAAVFATAMTGKYVTRISTSVKNWQNSTEITGTENKRHAPAAEKAALQNTFEKTGNAVKVQLDVLRRKFERLPLVSDAISYVDQVLRTPENRKEIIKFIARKTGGMVNFATGIVGTVAAFFCDLLLTAFFALLFLHKFAELTNLNKKQISAGSYLVKAIFNGKWLPRSGEETAEEAQRIIDGTFNRLKVWVKGYLTLVLVDATVYTTLFYFLRVPCFPLLGALAGCGILLPYIGPVISCALTLLVTLAVGGATGVQLVGILVCYLIYNGIVEQFILYPAVIGESLGLTTLETIIVVLLGAIFAGIPGMILALPAASVAKYLVPRIYKCWIPQKNGDS